jgi:hypothetical protein
MKFFFALLFLMIVDCAFGQSDEENKPVLKLNVSINNQNFEVSDGDTLRYGNMNVIVTTSSFMTFDFGSITFDYPKHFAFQFEEDFGYKNWTLDGNNFVIMYMELGVEVGLDPFVKEMADKFGKKNCKISDKKVKLGDMDLTGKRIDVSLVGQRLSYDIFRITTGDYKTHFIAFQDLKAEDGSDSTESVETMAIVNKTIKLK